MIRKNFTAPLVVILSMVVLSISATPASAAIPDPGGDLFPEITELLTPAPSTAVVQAPPPSAAVVQAPPPSSDSDLPGNETEDPTGPDHGSTRGLESSVAGQDVAGVGNDNATVNDDDSTTADSALLTLGGQEVLGTHADSNGANESHFGDPLAPVCEGSSGGVCLTVLYADAFATDDGSTSHSQSRSGIANACAGGTSTDPAAPCQGLAGVGTATSQAQADRDQSSGRTTASSMFEAASLCLQPDPITGACTLNASALHSEGQADSGTDSSPSSASRSSYLLDANFMGTSLGTVEDPTDLSIQPECADPSLLCVFLNQGETYLASGIAGHAQDALKLTVLPAVLDVFAGLGHTETLVHNDGGNPPPPPPPPTDVPDGPKVPDETDATGDGAALPNTGGPWSGLLALGLIGIAAGCFAVASGRRERVALG